MEPGQQRLLNPTEARDRQYPRVTEVRPVLEQYQRRYREYHARGDRGARGGAGSDDVVFEYAGSAEHPQYRHRYDGSRNGRRDRHAGEQPEVSIRRGEDYREDDSEHDRTQCEFARGLIRHGWLLPLAGLVVIRWPRAV